MTKFNKNLTNMKDRIIDPNFKVPNIAPKKGRPKTIKEDANGKILKLTNQDIMDKIMDMKIKDGASQNKIMNYLKKDLGYSSVQSSRYLKEASAQFNSMVMIEFANTKNEDIARWEVMRQGCVEREDWKGERECMIEICKIKGHYINNLNITGGLNNTMSVLTIEMPIDNNPLQIQPNQLIELPQDTTIKPNEQI